MLRRILLTWVVAPAIAIAAQPVKAVRPASAMSSVDPTLRAARLTTFLSLLDVVPLKTLGVRSAGTTNAGPGGGPQYHTLFVPTDLAFARMAPGALDGLRRNPERARAFVLAHLVEGNVTIGELPVVVTDGTSRTVRQLKTRAGTVLTFVPRAGTQFPEINGRAQVGPFQDVRISDFLLVIHEVDAVLVGEGTVSSKENP